MSAPRRCDEGGVTTLSGLLSPAALAAIEDLIDERIDQRLAEHDNRSQPHASAPASPFMTIKETATFLRCRRQRIDDLLSQGKLQRFKDGARTLIARTELEAYINNGRGR